MNLENLREAIAIIRTEQDKLNTTSHSCDNCGSNRYEDWDERQWHDQLDVAVHRLERVIREFDHKKNDNPPRKKR